MTLLGVLGSVPQPLAVARPGECGGRIRRRQKDLGMQHVAAAAVVVQLAAALIADALTGAVGGGRGGAAAGGTTQGADLQVEDRHGQRACLKLTRSHCGAAAVLR